MAEGEVTVESLVEQYLPMAVQMARRCEGRGVDRDELESDAQLGLLMAARKASEDGDIRDFQAYARLWIAGALRRLINDAPFRLVAAVPHRLKEAAEKCRQANERLAARGIRRPQPDQLAWEAGLKVETVLLVMEIPGVVVRQSAIEWADSQGQVAYIHGPELTPIFGCQPGFTPQTTCANIHPNGPIPHGSGNCCMAGHESGMDHHPALKRSKLTDPKPEPKRQAVEPPVDHAHRPETRTERRQRLFAPQPS